MIWTCDLFDFLTTLELNSDSNPDFSTTFGALTYFDNHRSYKTFLDSDIVIIGVYEKGGKRVMPFLHSFLTLPRDYRYPNCE